MKTPRDRILPFAIRAKALSAKAPVTWTPADAARALAQMIEDADAADVLSDLFADDAACAHAIKGALLQMAASITRALDDPDPRRR
jgi:hypothetical protein